MFSRVPWVIIKQLPLGPLLEGLGWKFLRQGNFFNKALCLPSPHFFSSFLPSQNILPSLSHLLVPGPSLLVTHLLPSSGFCSHRHRSGAEKRWSWVWGALCQESFIPVLPPLLTPCTCPSMFFLWKVTLKRSACEERPPQTQQAELLETDKHSGEQRPASQAHQEMKLLCATMRERISELCA